MIDDGDFYYLPLFQRDGYTIEKWNDVDDLPKLESGYYDLILLDIQGVGSAQTQEQGLGILRHLRQTSPAQILVAYSNADWSLKYQPFFDLADAVLAKGTDYVDFKRTVDDLLRKKFSLGFYLDRIVNIAEAHVADTARMRTTAEKAILQRHASGLEAFLSANHVDPEVASTILQVAQVAIGILGLLK
ncbi:MAG: hypothetical protein WA208_11865 [Thermoanaerobaculia bacterium]